VAAVATQMDQIQYFRQLPLPEEAKAENILQVQIPAATAALAEALELPAPERQQLFLETEILLQFPRLKEITAELHMTLQELAQPLAEVEVHLR
jgi:hypothetical protein